MAEGKKTVLVYTDWREYFTSLTDEEAGRLIKHFFDYINDLDPIAEDRITELSFTPIKLSLKRDLKKWETELENKSQGGRLGNLKRWHLDLFNLVSSGSMTLENAEVIAKGRIPIVTDVKPSHPIGYIADKDTDTDTDKDTVKEKEEKLKKSVELLYGLYPTRCPVKKVSTGKGEKDKERIKALLKRKTFDQIKESIEYYLKESKGRYILNFKTLLGNLPEVVREEKNTLPKVFVDPDSFAEYSQYLYACERANSPIEVRTSEYYYSYSK